MPDRYHGLNPILCSHLIRNVDWQPIDLLRSLAPAEWDLQTFAPFWRGRDVAAHLPDSALRKVWRLFTKGIGRESTRTRIEIE